MPDQDQDLVQYSLFNKVQIYKSQFSSTKNLPIQTLEGSFESLPADIKDNSVCMGGCMRWFLNLTVKEVKDLR